MTSSFIKKDTDKFKKKIVAESQSMVLNTDGLYYAEFFDYMFRGHFENIEINREDMEFLMIFEQYLRAFGKQCSSYLPDNKVEIMEQICVAEEITRNGYGMEIGRVCVEWKWVGTGLYARPELYNAKMEVESIQRAESLRTVMAMITDPNAMGNSMDMVHKINGLKNDTAQIFTLNPCNSTGIKRFEENLRLFALNKPSIRMQGNSKYEAMKKSGGPTGFQNFNKLVDDLITSQSKTWAFNRYVPGSISGLTILSKDNQGRPITLKANYKFKGFGNGNNGLVTVTFKKGLPDCIYFADFPNNCKTPNSSIVVSYAQGNYKKD
tara:strand:- start:75 stop:1040 length:966 start_codon:yes stop_codon:yes gene_type:complete